MATFVRRVRSAYVFAYKVRQWLRNARADSATVPLRKKIAAWRAGFFPISHVLYDFDLNARSLYLTDFQENVRAGLTNSEYREYADNKILFHDLVSGWVNTPDIIAVLLAGQLVPRAPTPVAGMLPFLQYIAQRDGGFVLKPIAGAGGLGVYLIREVSGGWEINGSSATHDQLLDMLKSLDHYLVSKLAMQAAYSQAIFARTVNTIRILTMFDDEQREVFVAAAAHRFGTSQSYPADNCARGGLTAAIDLHTGRLGAATTTHPTSNELRWFTHHPDSGAAIKGVLVPRWTLVRDEILALAQRVEFLRYVGWDIVSTDTSFSVLEANYSPDIKLHQVHAPLLRDERVRRVYRQMGVIR